MSTGSSSGTEIKLKALDQLGTWLSAQPITNVLLILILAMIAGGGYAIFKYAVPIHLQMIQTGYERIEKMHDDRDVQIEKSHNDQLNSRDKEMQRTLELLETIIRKQAGNPAGNLQPGNLAGATH